MKLLIFSDNHRNRENILTMLSQETTVDRIISLGDSEMSEIELSNLNIIGVKGNYPFEPDFPYELHFEFEGWKFLLTHGHHYSVKSGITRLYEAAINKEMDVACFGHTHNAYLEDLDDVVLLNPGSLAYPKNSFYPSYALVTVTEKRLRIDIIDLASHVCISSIDKKRGS